MADIKTKCFCHSTPRIAFAFMTNAHRFASYLYLVHTMSPILPRHIFPLSFFKIHFNIIPIPTFRSSKRTRSLKLFRKILCDLFLPCTRDVCLITHSLYDIFSLTTNYHVSHYPILFSRLLSLSRSYSFSFRMSRQRFHTFGYTETAAKNFLCNAWAYLPNCKALYPKTEVHIDSCENLKYYKRYTFYDHSSARQYRPTPATQFKQIMPAVCL
jgi:hypothetical protein